MGIMVYSFLWVMQDLCHQVYGHEFSSLFRRHPIPGSLEFRMVGGFGV